MLKFFAMDDSSDKVLIQKRSMNEKLIDYYLVDFNSGQNILPTNGLSNELNWIEYNSILGSLNNKNFKT
jgi:hypothetical protein